MNLSRRELLKWGAGAAALAVTPVGRLPAADNPNKKIPVALQLYSVRHQAAKDLPGVLEAVAKMGYQGVEFAGYYGHSADAIRKLLDDNGLKCCGSHNHLDALQGDALAGTVEFNQTIGNPNLIVSWMPPSYAESLQSVKKMAAVYDALAGKVKEQGMRVGYHAHGGDFKKIDGRFAWDLFFENTAKDVIMQLDVGNCLGGGGDPYATLRQFPGRSVTIHLKEQGGPPEAVLGEGDVDWQKVFTICETTGGTEWYIVEHERSAGDPLDNVKRCLVNVRKILAGLHG